MLVADLKKVIEKYDKKEKDKIIVELYKRIPKRVKEDYDIDSFITNVKNNTKTSKKEEKMSFDDLENEIVYFLRCANSDLYAVPNNVISKSERSKWRFKVKKYYKELIAIPPDDIYGDRATDLLKSLYRILSTGSCVLKFSSWNTFGAIQVAQSDFLEVVVSRKLTKGCTRENLIYCIDLLEMNYDPQEWHVSVLTSFTSCLKTTDMKNMTIEILKEKVKDLQEKLKEVKNNYRKSYDIAETINYFTECILYIYISLCEVDKGTAYFFKNYQERFKEIKAYILLERLEMFEQYDKWIEEYERHKDIDYRDSLKEKYKELKEKSK